MDDVTRYWSEAMYLDEAMVTLENACDSEGKHSDDYSKFVTDWRGWINNGAPNMSLAAALTEIENTWRPEYAFWRAGLVAGGVATTAPDLTNGFPPLQPVAAPQGMPGPQGAPTLMKAALGADLLALALLGAAGYYLLKGRRA